MSAFDLQAVETAIAGTEFAGQILHFPSGWIDECVGARGSADRMREAVSGSPMNRRLGVGAAATDGTLLRETGYMSAH